ncbi:GP128 [Caviid betaherpesvirus 2]|uniref:PGP128 n=2 Tax=Caviid betaherpesvirus 2 TaxID=33706 RepID=B7TQ17_9BETA|nr:GP128 [Caviid betaherpesvirus 2]AGE11584.1 GP128 [Caviid betaherpesvirus 2]AIL83971.1 GP128 [BAC cloning vector GPN13BACdenovo_preserved(MM)]BAH86633.1 pGP128 [Caviid betaherpesvirus 2]BAJ78572.1 GP128 [Caviid betaherpesvirus 2]
MSPVVNRLPAARLRTRGPLRSVQWSVGYAKYLSRLPGCKTDLSSLRPYVGNKIDLRCFISTYNDTFFRLSWPTQKSVYVSELSEIVRAKIDKIICARYGIHSPHWIVTLGSVVNDKSRPLIPGASPLLLTDDRGRFLLYDGPILSCYQETSGGGGGRGAYVDSLCVVAESVELLISQGLSRSDWCYSAIGGAPYCTAPDQPLRLLTNWALDTKQLCAMAYTMGGYCWDMRGVPTAERDAFFVLSMGDIPRSMRLYCMLRPEFTFLGYMVETPATPLARCQIFILLSEKKEVYAYIRSERRSYKIAKTVDSFFRVSTQRLYVNTTFHRGEDTRRYPQVCLPPPQELLPVTID